jgi:hypothetical protein
MNLKIPAFVKAYAKGKAFAIALKTTGTVL